MRKISTIFFMLLLAAVSMAQQVTTKTFYVNDTKKRDVVTFTSKAPLETIVGTTADVSGFVTVNLDDIKGSAKARFEVDLTTLKTGIEMRDNHMRDNFLETGKYPKAIFELTKVDSTSQNRLENQKQVTLTMQGNFTVHGTTKPITIPATITYYSESDQTKARAEGDLMHIAVNFDMLLGDYGIKRPQMLFMKLDETQKINIDMIGSTASAPVEKAAE
jgi:polyisoprenoid-binding protein YceI